MGNWHIAIDGTGCHHNENYDADADKAFFEFIEKLKKDGHIISYASFTYGGRAEHYGD